MRKVSKNMKETCEFAEMILGILKNSGSTILTLSGPLGSGKTAIAKCIAKLLGVTSNVTSPTFVLRSDYKTTDNIFKNFIHIDAYRMEDQKEIFSVGWLDLLKKENTLIVIEWPEKIREYVPLSALSVLTSVTKDTYTFSTI